MPSSFRQWDDRVNIMIRLMIALLIALGSLQVAVAQQSSSTPRRIALTFDDIPRNAGAFMTPDERTDRLIAALRDGGVRQAAFFINPGNLENPDGAGGEARIAAYVAAGHVIANHSYSHPHHNQLTSEEYLANIDRAEAWLRGRPGYRPWFRAPYLDYGYDNKAKFQALMSGLAQRGLRDGYVTADGSDWFLDGLTIDATREGKTLNMAALKRLYVGSQMSGIEYHDALAQRTLGRSPAHVMLLHETDIAALFIGDLINELKAHGWQIITADEAFADPMAQMVPDVPVFRGSMTGMLAWQRDIQPPLWPIWTGNAMIKAQFDERVVRPAQPAPAP